MQNLHYIHRPVHSGFKKKKVRNEAVENEILPERKVPWERENSEKMFYPCRQRTGAHNQFSKQVYSEFPHLRRGILCVLRIRTVIRSGQPIS